MMIIYGDQGQDAQAAGTVVTSAVEPISWAALAGLFLEKLTEAFATGLGAVLAQGVGQAILSVLGLGGSSNDTAKFQAMLDSLARRIIAEVRLLIAEDRIREANARIASQFRLFEYYLRDRASNEKMFALLRVNVHENWDQLVSLTIAETRSGTLASLMAHGVLLIGIEAEHFRIAKLTPGTDVDAARNNLLGTIEIVMKALEGTISLVEDDFKARVWGPEPRKLVIACRDFIDVGGGVLRPIVIRYEVDGQVGSIDGKWYAGASNDCDGPSEDAQAVVAKCRTARAELAARFTQEYSVKYEKVREEASRLKKSIEGF